MNGDLFRIVTRLIIVPFVAATLAACEQSAAWYLTHPKRQSVEIDGKTIQVIPREGNRWDAFANIETGTSSVFEMRDRNIRAIETVSKCQVVESSFLPNSAIFQARVKCP